LMLPIKMYKLCLTLVKQQCNRIISNKIKTASAQN
jgi:hypothetical protein